MNDNSRMIIAICPTGIKGIDGKPKKDWVDKMVDKIKNYFKGFPWDGPEYQAHRDMTESKFYTWNEAKKCRSDKK
jgi:hypothetical protein